MPSTARVIFDAGATGQTLISGLWVSDGSLAGTSLVKQGVTGFGFTQLNTSVLFQANDAAHGFELWITDGTSAGTSLLSDVYPGTTSGFSSSITGSTLPTSLRPAGGKMVFLGKSTTHVPDLWVTDGSSAGTSLLKNFDPGNTFAAPSDFAAFGSRQLFQASDGLHHNGDGLHGAELWVTDGTVAGTTMVADINPRIYGSSSPRNITDLGNGKAIFSADGGGSISRELWVTDGTAAGTSLVKDIYTGFYKPSNIGPATLLGTSGQAVFAAIGSSVGTQLWVTDGTTPGTSLLKGFSSGYRSGGFAFLSGTASGNMQGIGNKVIFTGKDAGVSALWGTDGTVAGTVKLSPDNLYVQGLTDGNGFTALGSKELFWAGSGLGARLWSTDGTAAGTMQLSATLSGTNGYAFATVGTKALFVAATNQLWTTDGTVAGTSQLTTLTGMKKFTVLGNQAFFQANDGVHGAELWVSDGTFGGTSLVKDINTNNSQSFAPYGASSPGNLAAIAFACFAAGTRITTADGATLVEKLQPGDLVRTASNALRPVRWIGHRHVNLGRHPRPQDVTPIRIAPHSFGRDLPHTALVISPDHAVFADGVLVPARYLVNGTTIARDARDKVTWYHVELADDDGAAVHDIILAEGLPTESYLDTGNRAAFANGGPAVDLHPDFARRAAEATWQTQACAQLVVEGPELVAVRSWLLHCAAELGYRVTANPDVRLVIDGRPAVVTAHGQWLNIVIPSGAQTLSVDSRTTIPAESDEAASDTRVLGVAVAGLRFNGDAARLGHPRFKLGWHPPEPGLRWTHGTATLDVTGLDRVGLALVGALGYWDEGRLLAQSA